MSLATADSNSFCRQIVTFRAQAMYTEQNGGGYVVMWWLCGGYVVVMWLCGYVHILL